MIASILEFLSSSLTLPRFIFLPLAAAAAAGFLFLSFRLDVVTAARDLLQVERDAAVADGLRWKLAFDEAAARAENLRALAQASLERESGARADAVARAAILQRTQTSALNAGAEEVVDEHTRRAAIARLNRSF
jgi:hypothetical protein